MFIARIFEVDACGCSDLIRASARTVVLLGLRVMSVISASWDIFFQYINLFSQFSDRALMLKLYILSHVKKKKKLKRISFVYADRNTLYKLI